MHKKGKRYKSKIFFSHFRVSLWAGGPSAQHAWNHHHGQSFIHDWGGLLCSPESHCEPRTISLLPFPILYSFNLFSSKWFLQKRKSQTMSCSTLCRIVTFFVPLILSLFMMISDPEGSVFNSKANTSPGFTRVSCKVNPCRCGTSGQCRCQKTHKAGKQTVFYCLHYTSPTLLCSSVRWVSSALTLGLLTFRL